MSFFRQATLPPDVAPQRARDKVRLRENSKASVASTVSETAGLVVDERLEKVYRKISLRIFPLFTLVIFASQFNRNNLSFAALTLNRDLKFSSATYGLGAAVFFLTFCICQVPSNLIMVRVGVRRWLSFLVLAWGCISACMSLMKGKMSFFALRLLLGAFQAGATPAMWFHLSQFFPQERLTKPFTMLTVSSLISSIFGPPLAAGFLAMDGIAGLKGWQFLFLLEGLPCIALAVLLFCVLPDQPDDVSWLTDSQKELLQEDMAESVKHSPPREHIPRSPFKLLRMVISNPLILYMSVVGFITAMTAYTYVFWSPIIINALLNGQVLGNVSTAAKPQSMELKPILLSCLPFLAGAITSWAVASHSQRTNEVYYHTAACLAGGGVLFLLFPVLSKAAIGAGFAGLVLTAAVMSAGIGPSNSVVARISAGPSQVVGMPVYSSISVLGGFIGPFVTGAILQSSNRGMTLVCVIMGGLEIVVGCMVAGLKFLAAARERRLAAAAAAAADDDGCESWKDCEQELPVKRKTSGPDTRGDAAAADSSRGLETAAAAADSTVAVGGTCAQHLQKRIGH